MKTYTPAQWMLIDLASQYGHDKWFFDDRLQFGREVLEMLEISDVRTIEELKDLMHPMIYKAEEPEMFAKALIAIMDVRNGEPTGHIVGLDASNSGPQLLSVLCRCIVGMKNTGVIDTGKVPDLYSRIFEVMESALDIIRDQVKKATVPFVYGSDAAPQAVFGDEAPNFVKAYTKCAPWAAWARETLINLWNEKALTHMFPLPDGFIANNIVMRTKDYSGDYKGVGFTYRCQVNEPKRKGMKGTKSLAANVTHAYDAYLVRELQRRCNYEPVKLQQASRIIEMTLLGEEQFGNNIKLARLNQLYSTFNNLSLEAIEHLEQGMLADIDKSYLRRLNQLIQEVLEYPAFWVRTIH